MRKLILTFCAGILAFATGVFASSYKYTDLQLKDYDEMRKEVSRMVQEAKSVSEGAGEDPDAQEEADRQAVEKLREALLFIFSRPDRDNMASKLIPPVSSQLKNFNSYEDTLSSLAGEAIFSIQRGKRSALHRATYFFVLQNILSEAQPYVKDRDWAQKLLYKVRDADLKISKDVKKNLRKRSMFKKIDSPSKTAHLILKKKGVIQDK